MLQSFPPYAMNFQDSGYWPPTRPKKSAGEEPAGEEEEYVFV
jgi:hypothetical protein